MTYFGGEKAVPGYNVMGICKAALDSCVKYLAFDLGPAGVRVNALSAGPVRTLAGRAAGVEDMLGLYEKMSPLGRNVTHDEVGRTGGYLLSDMSDGITGEILHVDCGYNIMGSPGRLLDARIVKPRLRILNRFRSEQHRGTDAGSRLPWSSVTGNSWSACDRRACRWPDSGSFPAEKSTPAKRPPKPPCANAAKKPAWRSN